MQLLRKLDGTAVKELVDRHKKTAAVLLLACIFFLSVGQHLLAFWELPALSMLGLFIILVPLIVWGLRLLLKRIHFPPAHISRGRWLVLMITTLAISAALAWFFHRLPATYHVLTITPLVSGDQRVELIEVKAGGAILAPDEKKALDSGWQVQDDLLIATRSSGPLVISFKAAVDAPVTALFYATPQGGSVRTAIGNEHRQLDLHSLEERQTTSTLVLNSYRGIPNWIFIPGMIVVDILTFGSLLLAIFILQETGQALLASPPCGERSHGNRMDLAVLLGLSILLHLVNALSVPLTLYSDSPSYLAGALHLVEFGNLDLPLMRGPVTAFLFAPILFFLGRNPWGIKVCLHLIALACVPLGYRIGWQLGRNRWIAFAGGLASVLSPDLLLYSNIIMSDLPNIFLVLLFCTLLISALESFKFRSMLAVMLTASVATLLRTENLTLLLIAAFALAASWLRGTGAGALKELVRRLAGLGLTLLVALLPLLWWSVHNQRVSGFLGLSNYTGAVVYDGWIYFGEASGLPFTDPHSPAVQALRSALERYPIEATDQSGAPTSWEIYPSLIQAGYTPEQAFGLMEAATRDSFIRDPALDLKLLKIKIREGLSPGFPEMITLPLPPEEYATPKMGFFDEEGVSIPFLIRLQRTAYGYMEKWYAGAYPFWVLVCMAAMIFCLFRSPKVIWITLVLIAATRIFIPNLMGLSNWRYTLAGLIPLQILAVQWLAALIHGGLAGIGQSRWMRSE